MLGRLEDVPLTFLNQILLHMMYKQMLDGMGKNPGNQLVKMGFNQVAVGSYFDKPSDHMATPLLNHLRIENGLQMKEL